MQSKGESRNIHKMQSKKKKMGQKTSLLIILPKANYKNAKTPGNSS